MNRIYVGNLSFNTDEESLLNAFSRFGDVSEAKLVMDRETGRSRGFAFVSMANAEDARSAISEMNGAMLDGRSLRVNEAEERQPRGAGGGRPSFGGGDRRPSTGRGRW